MRFDLLTLYLLAIGTLLLSAGMTLWERHARPQRSKQLRLLAAGYATLAIGCAVAIMRSRLPGALAPAVSNITMVAGYLLILNGVASLNGRQHRAASISILSALTLAWGVGGVRSQESLWSYIGGIPIAVVSAATAWEMLRSSPFRSLRARRVIAAATAVHATLYMFRAFVLPLLVGPFGPTVLSMAAKATMYEGVLYSVALPMALLALVREEAHDQLLKASRTDHLTGLSNRGWFFEEGERWIGDSTGDRRVSLLAFDLDHFKAINDQYGHPTGDEVLRVFARRARTLMGDETLLARIGGEEFVALLPGESACRAKELGQAVAISFADTITYDSAGRRIKATVSIGLAELGRDGAKLSDLLSAADRALYVAKSRGRNRIEFATPITLAAACWNAD